MARGIPLTLGLVAIVDDEDYDRLAALPWSAIKSRETHYAKRTARGVTNGKRSGVQMHREILDAPPGVFVDHINGNGLDNRRANLRLCTHGENVTNRGLTKLNTSGFKGVSWNTARQAWAAAITSKGVTRWLGDFTSSEAAAEAYDAAAVRLHGVFAKTNADLRLPSAAVDIGDVAGRHQPAPRFGEPAARLVEQVEYDTNGGCWLWTGRIHRSYGVLGVGGKQVRAHRLSYELHRGPIPGGLLICHRCDVRTCVNPDHLFAGTHQANSDDKVAKGRQRKGALPSIQGERHYLTRLTEAQVREIRASTGPLGEAADRYGISRSTVSMIRLRHTWRHVSEAA